ncbi:MAG: cytochrome-c oxidase, cbb3-type subunit III, partial [Thiotrichales bacterium]
YCAQCHGADAGGSTGFPSLKDGDWLWGGDFGAIKTSILDGRAAVMPAYDGVLDAATTEQVVEYVLTLSGREADASAAEAGKATFEAQCAACHMPDGTGNVAMGAPNLTDKIWLYGSTKASITESIVKGRAGQMPAYRDFLGEDRVHVLSAYVANLSAK